VDDGLTLGLKIEGHTLEERNKCFFDLQVVCRDVAEGMTFDGGEVLFHKNPPPGTPSYLCTNLATWGTFDLVITSTFDSKLTFIRDPWVTQPPPGVPGADHPLCSRGVVAWPGGFDTDPYYGGSVLTKIRILYDATDYPSGQGYIGHDASGANLNVEAHHLLAFGLGSAGQIAKQFEGRRDANASTPWSVDPQTSLAVENAVRAQGVPVFRAGPLEFYLPTCTERPGKVWTPPEQKAKYTGNIAKDYGCFVATAAYGSPFAAEVQLLREFRDTVLRRTRTGEAWFERFYQRYDEISPPIAARMRNDPELADAFRVGIVQPYVGWLELAMKMPEAPLDGVPEPWREVLALLIDRMDAWASEAMPADLDGVDGLEAARELAVVLRYGFRDHRRRSAYLDRLAAAGALPLDLSGDEAEAAREVLLGAGLPASHVARVVDEVPEEARA
jgi:hypothetical protein